MTPDTLHPLLTANLQFPPEYQDQLSNHLPMALHALSALGAPEARLRSFFDRYAQRFGDARAPQAAAAALDWRALRAQPAAYAALCASFAAMIDAIGVDATLRRTLPDLWPGVAAAAFHGLIRTAHAVQGGHPGELAHALAYWAWRWQRRRRGARTRRWGCWGCRSWSVFCA